MLIRVDPVELDRALQHWNQVHGGQYQALAIDGKTMCNAIDEQGYQIHIMSAVGHQTKTCHTQKKVGSLPAEGDDKLKRTNEIKVAIPLLDVIDIEGKDISAGTLLTQRNLGDYVVIQRKAHYHFTVKGNQPTLLDDIRFYFQYRQQPDFIVSGSTGFCGHVFSGAYELKNDLESGSRKSFEDISVIPESENS